MGVGIELVAINCTENSSGRKKPPRTSVHFVQDNHNDAHGVPYATTFSGASSHDLETGLDSKTWKPGVPEVLVITCIFILVVMDAFNAIVVIPLIPDLSNRLRQPLESTLWLNTAYFLANATSQTLSSMLADVFGHGPVLLAAVVLATIGTGVCGGSSNLPGLIAGRSIQGTGGGGVMAVSLLIITELIPMSHQVEFSSYIFRAQVTGAILGAIMGGLFGDYVSWIWVFYSSFVFAALGMLVVPFAVDLRGTGGGKAGYGSKLRGMDWVGAILLPIGLGSMLLGVSWGGTLYPWGSPQTLAPICVGMFLLLLLIIHEGFWAIHPIFSTTILARNLSTKMIHLGGFLHGLLISSHLQFIPTYLTFVKYLSCTFTGLSLATLTAPILPSLICFSKTRALLRNPTLTPWIIRTGWILATLSTGCLTILDSNTPTPAWIILFLVAGLSHALLLPAYNISLHTEDTKSQAQDQEPDHETGKSRPHPKPRMPGILVQSILRTWGMSIAIAISGTLLLNQLFWNPRAEGGIPESFSIEFGEALLPGGDRGVYVDGFRVLWPVFTGVAALGGICSLVGR